MPKKILLVDDAKLVLEVERSLLKRTGCELVTAGTGAEALRRVIEDRPDLVLLDFILPDMTGDKICAQIKANPATADIPVVMVTTKSSPEYVERCRQAGCDDYMTKPLQYQELLTKAAQLLRIPHRISKRILVRLEAALSSGDGQDVFFGTTLDVSAGGMLVESARKLEIGDRLRVRFRLDATHEIDAMAQIVRIERRLFYKFGYGLRLDELSPEDRDRLARFVESHLGGEVT